MKTHTLLFYCQHSVGIGHLTRSFAIARAFAGRWRVVFLNGGPLPAGIDAPEEIEIVNLAPLGTNDGHSLVSRSGEQDLDAVRAGRRDAILSTLRQTCPDVLFIELFPFGRKKFAFELLPLLKAARRGDGGKMPQIVSSLRDLLVSARPDQQAHDDRASWLCRRYFDSVLIHADPALARLEDTFKPRRAPGIPVHYTGFVVPDRKPVTARTNVSDAPLLVSAGSGSVGGPLFRAAIEAHSLMSPATRPPLHVVAGPFLGAEEWAWLQAAAQDRSDVRVDRVVPDLAACMRGARASLSQCGYNSALDIVVSGVPALVAPYGDARENEQSNRAARLAELGVVRALPAGDLDPVRLARELDATLGFRPAANRLDLDGARRTVEIVESNVVAGTASRVRA